MSGRRARRVPLRLQHTTSDCGPACLAMVRSALGCATSVAEAADLLSPGRDGVSIRDLRAAGAELGLTLRVLRAPLNTLARLPGPLIAYWRQRHYVVIEEIGARWVRIADPGRGRLRLTLEEFAAGYSGVVLAVAGVGTMIPAERTPWWRSPVARLLAGTLRDRRLIGGVVLASLGVQLFGLLVPAVTRLVVNRSPAGAFGALVTPLLLITASAVATRALVTWLRAVLLIRLQNATSAVLMRRLVRHTFALPYRFFETRGSGDLMERMASVSMIRDLVTERSLAFVFDLVTALGFMVFLAAVAPEVAAVTGAVAVAQFAVAAVAGRVILRRAQVTLHAQIEAQNALVESLQGIETLKSVGGEEQAVARWDRCYDAELAAVRGRDRATAATQTLTESLQLLLTLGLLLLVGRLVSDAPGSLGDLLAVAGLAGAATAPLGSLLGTVQQVNLAAAQIGRVGDLLSAEPEPTGELRPAGGLRGGIELRGVGFAYDARQPVLQHVSLRIPPGHRVAIVGPSGSGKTTLGRVLLGLLEPAHGQVLFDGVPLERIDRRWLRSRVGAVPQRPFLFRGPVADNITMGRADIGDEEIRRAARLAGIDRDIEAWPMGYRTDVGESGDRVSGGQRQRIALARALLSEPRILLLDEPTSSLDAAAEHHIQKGLRSLGCTQVVIAHRLSTVRDADLIVVLEAGRVVETGTHDELVARSGTYARLVGGQREIAR